MYSPDTLDTSLTRAMQAFLRINAQLHPEKEKVILPAICKDIFASYFKKRNDDMVRYIASALTNDQTGKIETWLARRVKVSVAFDEPDWTVWPFFGSN